MAYQPSRGETQGVTPDGILNFAHLITPDTRFNDHGVFSINLSLEPEDTAKMRAMLQNAIDVATEEGELGFKALTQKQKDKLKGDDLDLRVPGDVEYGPDDAPTGRTVFKFKTSATIRTGRSAGQLRVVNVFSASGKRITGVNVNNNSEGAVAFMAKPYFMPSQGMAGVTLYLNSVQLLVQGGTGSNVDSGFAVRQGYAEIEVEDAGTEDEWAPAAAPVAVSIPDDIPF